MKNTQNEDQATGVSDVMLASLIVGVGLLASLFAFLMSL
jgi:hypothetical protein